MLKSYKEFIDNRKKYRGFTLIELLAILVILFIIFSLVLLNFKDVFNSVEQTITETDKNTILNAANSYALEYRGSDGWVEEVKNDGTVNFCISLTSLINYGYFKNDDSNFEKYKNDYVVEFQIKNGVSDYKFINIEDSVNCKFLDFGSTIENSNLNTEIKDANGNSIGEFNYEVNQISEKKYSLNFDLSMKLIDMIRDIYVTLVFDKSQSMMGYKNKYDVARDAAINFSKELINRNSEIQISLITFDKLATKSREFTNSILKKENFPTSIVTNSYGTNIGAGLDMAISLMCSKGLDIDSSDSQWCTEISDVVIDNEKTKKLYTVLFFDGGMDHVPVVNVNNKNLNGNNIGNNNDKIKEYYDKFSSFQGFMNNGISDNSYSFDMYVKPSIERLKDDLDVNLFMIGYEFQDTKDYMKKAASNGDKLCVGSSYRDYCYYDAKTANLNNILNTILDNIVNDSGISSLKFSFSSVKSKDGEELITILNPDNSEVENNILEIKFDDLNIRNENLEDSLKGYKFILNDAIYEYCLDDEKECIFNEKLFNISLDIEYIDGTKNNDINLESPEFKLILTERKTLN